MSDLEFWWYFSLPPCISHQRLYLFIHSFFIVMFVFHHSSSSSSSSSVWLFIYDFTYERRKTEVTLFRVLCLATNTVAILRCVCVLNATQMQCPALAHRTGVMCKMVIFSPLLPAANHTIISHFATVNVSDTLKALCASHQWTCALRTTKQQPNQNNNEDEKNNPYAEMYSRYLIVMKNIRHCHFHSLTSVYHVTFWNEKKKEHNIPSHRRHQRDENLTTRTFCFCFCFVECGTEEYRPVGSFAVLFVPVIVIKNENQMDAMACTDRLKSSEKKRKGKCSWIEQGHVTFYYKTIQCTRGFTSGESVIFLTLCKILGSAMNNFCCGPTFLRHPTHRNKKM